MSTIMAIAIGSSYSGRHGRRDLNTYINPRYYFRTAGWYFSFHDRMKLEQGEPITVWSLLGFATGEEE